MLVYLCSADYCLLEQAKHVDFTQDKCGECQQKAPDCAGTGQHLYWESFVLQIDWTALSGAVPEVADPCSAQPGAGADYSMDEWIPEMHQRCCCRSS